MPAVGRGSTPCRRRRLLGHGPVAVHQQQGVGPLGAAVSSAGTPHKPQKIRVGTAGRWLPGDGHVPGSVPVDRTRGGGATLAAMIPAAETIDESQRFREPAAGAIPGLVLLWISERPAATVLPLNQGKLELGRTAQEQLFAEDDRVSREHCRIEYDGTGWTVRDLDSRNGTFVNGERVSLPFASVLRPLVRVGRTLAWGVEDVRPYRAGVALEDDGVLIGGRLRSAWTEIGLVGGTEGSLCLRGESGS